MIYVHMLGRRLKAGTWISEEKKGSCGNHPLRENR